jgi:hypothetical protein
VVEELSIIFFPLSPALHKDDTNRDFLENDVGLCHRTLPSLTSVPSHILVVSHNIVSIDSEKIKTKPQH